MWWLWLWWWWWLWLWFRPLLLLFLFPFSSSSSLLFPGFVCFHPVRRHTADRSLHSASTCSRSSTCSSCVISRPDTRATSQAPRSQWVSFERAGLLCLAAVPAVEPHAPLDVWRKGRPDTTGSPSTRTIPPLSASLDPTAWTGAKAILLAPTCRCSCYDEGPGQAPRCEARARPLGPGSACSGAPAPEQLVL